jgi:hypothetical protein
MMALKKGTSQETFPTISKLWLLIIEINKFNFRNPQKIWVKTNEHFGNSIIPWVKTK